MSGKTTASSVRTQADIVQNKSFESLRDKLFRLHSEGLQLAEIAEQLDLSEHTVKILTGRLMANMNCRTLGQLVVGVYKGQQDSSPQEGEE